jgi:hypothetical protein
MVLMMMMAGSLSYAASGSNAQVRQAYQEMRQNLAWVTQGLDELGKSNAKDLKLTAEQKKKILPVFEALVGNKLVMLSMPEQDQRHDQSSGVRGQSNPSDPKVQARLRKMKDDTAFGNQQADLIDNCLTAKQLSYIDNLVFSPEKYGFLDFQKIFGSDQRQRPDQKMMEQVRAKMRAGQELLVKLNNEVLKMLKP